MESTKVGFCGVLVDGHLMGALFTRIQYTELCNSSGGPNGSLYISNYVISYVKYNQISTSPPTILTLQWKPWDSQYVGFYQSTFEKQLPLHPPSFVLRPPAVNGDGYHSRYIHEERTEWRKLQVIGQDVMNASCVCVSTWMDMDGHGWTWTLGYIPMLRYIPTNPVDGPVLKSTCCQK